MSTKLKKQPVKKHVEPAQEGHRAERDPKRSGDVRRKKPKPTPKAE